MEEINKDNHIDNNDSGISEEQKIWASQHLPNDPHFQEDDDDGNHETFQESHENKSRHISVLEAKRIHSGTVKVRGRIVTVSEMYVIETLMPPNDLIYKDAKFIELEDTEKLNENERLAAILYDDLIQNVIAGEIVDIEGRMLIENKNNNKYSKKKIGVLHAESIRYVNRKELLITPRDIEAFERFAAYPNLILRLVLMFALNVIGHEDAKLGLLRSIVGGDDHGEIGNGRINTFMVGDFGNSKEHIRK